MGTFKYLLLPANSRSVERNTLTSAKPKRIDYSYVYVC